MRGSVKPAERFGAPRAIIIVDGYSADTNKFADASLSAKVRACFDSIPAQLAKENRKFQYKVVRRGGGRLAVR